MSGRQWCYRGWRLINTACGWFVEKDGERMRVGYSHQEHDERLDDNFRRVVDERERKDADA